MCNLRTFWTYIACPFISVRDQVSTTTSPPSTEKQNLYHIFIYCQVPHKLKEKC